MCSSACSTVAAEMVQLFRLQQSFLTSRNLEEHGGVEGSTDALQQESSGFESRIQSGPFC